MPSSRQWFIEQTSSVCRSRELVERTVVQDRNPVVEGLGLEAVGTERVEEAGAGARSDRAGAEELPGVGPDRPAFVPGRLLDRVRDGDAVTLGPVGRVGEQPARELVLTSRQAHRELRRGPSVDLGRASRAGAAPLRQASVVDVEQADACETVEMVRGDATPETDRIGSLLAAHPVAPGDDVLVQGAPIRFGEHAERVELVPLVDFRVVVGVQVAAPARDSSFAVALDPVSIDTQA